MPRRLAYASRPAADLQPADIARILRTSRSKNAATGIRGVLIYTGDAFAQWIEGEPDAVERLWVALHGDPRHHDLVAFLDEHDEREWLDAAPALAFLCDASLGASIAEWRTMHRRLDERERDAIRLLLASADASWGSSA